VIGGGGGEERREKKFRKNSCTAKILKKAYIRAMNKKVILHNIKKGVSSLLKFYPAIFSCHARNVRDDTSA